MIAHADRNKSGGKEDDFVIRRKKDSEREKRTWSGQRFGKSSPVAKRVQTERASLAC